MRTHRIIALGLGLLLALPLAAWALAVLWPDDLPDKGYGHASNLMVEAADGSLLAEVPNRERRCGPWLTPDRITFLLKAAAMAAEDRRFLWHPGVDPLALARSLVQNLYAGKVKTGASTITMQLARLERGQAPRTLAGKLREARRALWLEARLSKDEILCHYLNRAPFGGPLVGLAAASGSLLGKTIDRLAPHEAALLMALPQNPTKLLKPGHGALLKRRRDHILKAMFKGEHLSQEALNRALAQPLEMRNFPPPSTSAPHFLRALQRVVGGKLQGTVKTFIDPGLQNYVTGLIEEVCQARRKKGLRQAAALVLRNQDGAILAWVGSADWHDPVNGQVDGVLARRSPGSALKPFIYALALERGWSLARIIKDEPLTIPVAGGTFRPVDYDGLFRGPVSLRLALASSLNLPALRLVAELSPAAVLAKLRGLGFALPKDAQHYGIGLALGDGEVSLLEMCQAYAALANGGVYLPACFLRGQTGPERIRVFSPGVARLVADVLSDDRARGVGFGRSGVLDLPFPAAVKTGTSQKHRDNWCLGFSAEYAVGVWVGNFEGKPMAGLSGISGAGPLWRQIMLQLHRHRPGHLPPWPVDIKRLLICAESGKLPGGSCTQTVEELFLPGTEPKTVCQLHSASARMAHEQHESGLTLESPASGSVYVMDPDIPEPLQVLDCRAVAHIPLSEVKWSLNEQRLAASDGLLQMRLRLTPGRHHLRVTAMGPKGRFSTEARYMVLPSP